jgi:hypothetical protein
MALATAPRPTGRLRAAIIHFQGPHTMTEKLEKEPCPLCASLPCDWVEDPHHNFNLAIWALGHIREITGVGVKPMLSELPDAVRTAWNTRPSVGEPVACGMCSELLGPGLTHCPLGLESAEDDVKAQCGYRNPPPPLYTRPSVVPDREALITLIASFPAHAADLGPDNTVFADHIPSDGAGIGECPKPIERLVDAILSLMGKTVPEGFKLVPVEPTEAMWQAAERAGLGDHGEHHEVVLARIWSAMLLASQEG